MFPTVKRTVAEFQEDNLTDWAAALTYYAVLSIFPALIALVSIVGLVGDPKTITKELTDIVSSIGPASAADTLKEPIEDVTEQQRHRRHPADRGHRRRALDRLRLRRRVHARLERRSTRSRRAGSFIKLRPLQMR